MRLASSDSLPKALCGTSGKAPPWPRMISVPSGLNPPSAGLSGWPTAIAALAPVAG